MVFPNTYEKIIKLLAAMNEAGVKPELECFDTGHTHGHLAAPRHGRPEAAAPVLVHRQRARRHPAARRDRSSSRRRSCRAGQRVGGHRDQPRASGGCSRRRSCSAATSAAGSRTTSILPNGEMAKSQRRARRGRRADGARRRAPAGDGRRGAADPRRLGRPRVVIERGARVRRDPRSRAKARVVTITLHNPSAQERDRAADGERAPLRARRRARADAAVRVDRAHRRRATRSAPAATSRR